MQENISGCFFLNKVCVRFSRIVLRRFVFLLPKKTGDMFVFIKCSFKIDDGEDFYPRCESGLRGSETHSQLRGPMGAMSSFVCLVCFRGHVHGHCFAVAWRFHCVINDGWPAIRHAWVPIDTRRRIRLVVAVSPHCWPSTVVHGGPSV